MDRLQALLESQPCANEEAFKLEADKWALHFEKQARAFEVKEKETAQRFWQSCYQSERFKTKITPAFHPPLSRSKSIKKSMNPSINRSNHRSIDQSINLSILFVKAFLH